MVTRSITGSDNETVYTGSTGTNKNWCQKEQNNAIIDSTWTAEDGQRLFGRNVVYMITTGILKKKKKSIKIWRIIWAMHGIKKIVPHLNWDEIIGTLLQWKCEIHRWKRGFSKRENSLQTTSPKIKDLHWRYARVGRNSFGLL